MSKVNVEAKKERHSRLFEGHYQTKLGRIWFHTKRACRALWLMLKPTGRRWSSFVHPLEQMPAPKRLYTQLASGSLALLLIMSINVTQASYEGYSADGDYQQALAVATQASHFSDDEGYLIKNMPLEGETTFDRNRVELVDHTVQSGDTLSVIAYRYGVNMNSIRYANPGLNADYLKVGQVLKIPPKDGIYITVPHNATLLTLIDKYKGSLDETKSFNGLSEDTALTEGKQLFIVGGKPEITMIAQASTKGSSKNSGTTKGRSQGNGFVDIDAGSSGQGANSLGWVRPTKGGITQYYHAGHYAYDIAERDKPPVVAAMGGTIISAQTGWNGGYGTNVWIDHGNGYKTHYAHLEEFYVQPGDTVKAGDIIGKMGNTGRVYGVTGIHLHFEVEFNGTKINPSFMNVW